MKFLWTGVSWMGPYIRAIRIGRALSALVMIVMAIVVMSVVQCQESRDPVVLHSTEPGLVLEVRKLQEQSGSKVTLLNARGDTLNLLVPQPAPGPGDRVPLRVSEHRSGKKVYQFDRQMWLEKGPLMQGNLQ